MGLTKREDGWYVEFFVVDDGKVLKLARGTAGAKLKRWKTGTDKKTLAKQQEAMIQTELMKELIESQRKKCLSFAEWGARYLELEEVKKLKSYKERVHAVKLQLIPFFGKKPLGIVKLSEFDQKFGKARIHNSLIVQHSGYWSEVENRPNST